MDTRTQFMNEILGEMSNYLSSNDLELLRVTLLKRLNYVQVVPYTRLARIPQNMDINERFFKLFVASRRLEGMSEKTITYYTYETKRLLVRLDKSLPDITTLDVQYYLSDYERTHNVCRRSLENMRRSINGFFLWLAENEYIEKNPMSKIKPIAYEKRNIETLNEEEVYDIRECVRDDVRTRAIVELLLSTGVRVSELISINIENIDFDKGEITIHCAKKRQKQDRRAYLTVEATKSLRKYLEYRNTLTSPDGTALFISNRNNGRRVTERLVNSSLREIEKKIGLKKKLTVHVFRRTFATILWKHGCSPLSISRLLGHADTRMSETYYIGLQDEDIKRDYYKYR